MNTKPIERQFLRMGVRIKVRDPASGRRPDHKTIVLRDWHEVLMNAEHKSRTMRNVAFID